MTEPAVLITGALSGIGRATAAAYARQSARLVISGCRAAEEVADAIRFIASLQASFITGEIIHVNGGKTGSLPLHNI